MNVKLLTEIVERADKDFALALVPADTLKKLTELIVRECSEVCKQQSLHYAEHNNKGSAASAADACSFLVKLHFGVEE